MGAPWGRPRRHLGGGADARRRPGWGWRFGLAAAAALLFAGEALADHHAIKPLYYFAGDKAPGDTEGQGVKDVWYAAAP